MARFSNRVEEGPKGAAARDEGEEGLRDYPEFIYHALKAWLVGKEAKPHYIDPGRPWQNGFRESFHRPFCHEYLLLTLFTCVTEAPRDKEGAKRNIVERCILRLKPFRRADV